MSSHTASGGLVQAARRRGISRSAAVRWPERPDLALVYEETRLWFASIGVLLSTIIGTVTNWPNGPWVPLGGVAVVAHALHVRLSGSPPTRMTLLIDGAAIGAVTMTMGIPVVTATGLCFFAVVAAVLASRREIIWIALYGVAWAGSSFLWSYLDFRAPYEPRAKVIIEIASVLFFTSAIIGIVANVMGTLRSTEDARSEAEQNTRLREKRFRTMIQNSFDGVGLVDAKGRLLFGSDSVESLLGYTPAEMESIKMRDLACDEDPAAMKRLRQVGQRPGESIRDRLKVRRKDGAIRDLEIVATNMMNEPAVGRIVVNFRDITEEVAAEEALRKSNRQLEALVESKDQFVASVSHELRTPLTAVLGLAEELGRGDSEFDVAERQEFHQLIVREAREVAAIVEDLLVAARADIGKVSVHPTSVSLAESIAEIVTMTGVEQARSVTVSGDEVAWADPVRVRQVLRNLVVNTIRYGGPDVHITLGGDGHSSNVSVSDNGPGIAADDIDRIFEPYESAHTREDQPASIGLGLTVSRVLARLMGGDLTYERSEGWSTFRLTLPAAAGPRETSD